MSKPVILEAIARAVEELDAAEQERVLAYIRSVRSRPPGVSPAGLLKMAGSIPASDCDAMQKAIDEGCSQVNADAW